MNVLIPIAGLAILLAAPAASRGASEVPKQASDVRGISWSDPRDNYNPAQIVPAGLSLTNTPEQAEAVAKAYAKRAIENDINVVRLGINPPTVGDGQWWPIYRRVVETIAGEGLGVILCAWEQSPSVKDHGRGKHDGRFGAGTVQTYSEMWQAVHADFRETANVIGYELLNEPFGYVNDRDGYIRDMRAIISAIGTLRSDQHILVAGLGYSDNVQAIREAFPEPSVWFAYHVYPNWFGGEAGRMLYTRERYADEIAKQLSGVESRTVITEFGCWGGAAFNYAKPSSEQATLNAKRHVAYLHGVADACAKLKLGSIYWFADARETRTRQAYDLFATDGKPLDPDRMAEIRRAWRRP